jgi:hypothetical protein
VNLESIITSDYQYALLHFFIILILLLYSTRYLLSFSFCYKENIVFYLKVETDEA